jgi:hypothetical protein
MIIYEVVYWGSPGKGNEEDTIYLVRAHKVSDAVEVTRQFAKPQDHGGEYHPLPDIVYEIGQDIGSCLETFPRVLLGPCYAYAFNFGWRSWDRLAEDGSDTGEWREKKE